MAAINNNGAYDDNQDISLINRSAKDERTYNIFDSEKDRKIWERELESLKKKREAVKMAKSNPQEQEIETATEKDPEVREKIVRELINYLILSYEVTKKFPVCFGKEGYYYELLLGYLSDLDRKEREEKDEKGKENTDKLDKLAFGNGLSQRRKEKEAEAENEIDSLMKKRDVDVAAADNSEQKADEKIDKIIEETAERNEKSKPKIKVQVKKMGKERGSGRAV